MLYDILPPTIFMLSVSGIVVVLARVVMRMQKAEVTASMQSAVHTELSHQRILRPAQKSVQAVTSRAAVVAQAWRTQVTKISEVRAAAVGRLQARRQARIVSESLGEVVTQNSAGSFKQRLAGARTQVRATMANRLTTLGQARVKFTARVVSLRRPAGDEQSLTAVNPKGETIVQSEAALTKATTEATEGRTLWPATMTTKRLIKMRSTVATSPPTVVAPGPKVEPKKKRGLSVLDQARDALGAQQFQHAEDILVEYIVKHTKDTNAYMLLGQAAVGRQDWQEAAEIFEQVIAWNPAQQGAYAGLGSSAYRAGRYSKALRALQRAHEADPDNLSILEDLLSIARKMDNPALQKSISEKITELQAVRA